MAISRLMDGRSRRMLYEVLEMPNFYSLGILPLAEGGVELNVGLATYPLTREPYYMIVVRHHLDLDYRHGLECFPVEDVY